MRPSSSSPAVLRFFFTFSLALGLTIPGRAAPPSPAGAPMPQASPHPDGPDKGPQALHALEYRSIGPAAGGRVSRAVGIPGDPNTYYLAAASGGVWKSTDGGRSWRPIFDDQPISSIGSIAVAPSDPNVIYVGSGEANIRGNVAAGNGIYRSEDAGKTWTHVWVQEGQIGTMTVDPTNANVAFAAVLGHAFGPNPERGVYRTKDGGRTWAQVLKQSDDAGASDVALDASNPRIVFAGFWEARRSPWDLKSGGPGSGLYVSRNGGDTWKPLTGHGLPDGPWGKVGVAVAPSDGRRVYALIEAEDGGLFRSDDGGDTWSHASAHRGIRQRAWYYSTLTVDPRNPDIVWFPQVAMYRTIDGGKTVELVDGPHHGDNHDMWIDPLDPRRMISANDGGVNVTTDGGEHWVLPPIAISQFYHVSVDSRVPYRVAGAMQDLGTAQGPSNSLHGGGIDLGEWQGVGGGEAGWVVSKPDDPNVVYAGEYLGYLSRFDRRTGQARNVSPWPENPSGHGAEDMKYRFQWTAPIAASPFDPNVIYYGAQVVFRSADAGQSWAAISRDLTRNDKSKQQWSGGPITGDNTGVENYDTVFTIAESPKAQGLIWAGTDDGLVQVTRDGGKTWSNVTPAMSGIPEWATIDLVEPSSFDAGTAYVVADAHRLDDMRPYLYRTTDYGTSWTRLDGTLPQDVYLHAVREDPAKRGQLYLGTERGVMFSTDDGGTWQSLRLNMPTVAVHDLVVKDDSLVVGTHGRSLWILDDLLPVRQYTPAVAGRAAFLFPAANAVRWEYGQGSWANGPTGDNPPYGALLYYFLKDKPEGDVTIDILDASGHRVRRLSSKAETPIGAYDDLKDEKEALDKEALPADAGVQRAVWDLRYDGAKMIQDAKLDAGSPRQGPMATPGVYTARLTVDGTTLETKITVRPDPRLQVSQADLEAQLKLGLQVRDDITRLTELVNSLRSIRTQLQNRVDILKDKPEAAALVKGSTALIARLDALEHQIHNPAAEVSYDILAMKGGTRLYSRLAPLMDWITAGSGAPTSGMRQVFAEQDKELAGYAGQWDSLVSVDLAGLSKEASRLGIGFVVVK
jgi:photosystem II stability/assembly factor-like uncharacterized protein